MTDTDPTTSAPTASGQASLNDLRMPELQQLATRLGIKGISKMRKSDLVEAIRERRRANSSAKATEQPVDAAGAAGERRGGASSGPQQPALAEELDQRGNDSGGARQSGSGQSAPAQDGSDPARSEGTRQRRSRGRQGGKDQGARDQGARDRSGKDQSGKSQANQSPAIKNQANQSQATKNRGDKNQGDQRTESPTASGSTDEAEEKMASLDDIIHFPEPADRPAEGPRTQRRAQRQQGSPDRATESNDPDDDDDRQGGRRRRGRDRYRDRKRRQGSGRENSEEDVEILEDDVLIPVAGVLDVLDNYAFVRTTGYLPGANDVYVSLGQVKKSGLRRGDAIAGAVRQPREGEGQRQKFNALVRLDGVNGGPVDDALTRPDFADLVPMHPRDRLQLETTARGTTTRVLDLLAPIGKGQRALLVSPPQAGKTTILQQVAQAIATNNPEVHLMAVLVDERPEEATDWQRLLAGEVISSSFDHPASDHTTVAELALERAKRLVELGQDVVILLDSLTGLARAYSNAAPPSGRTLPAAVDALAVQQAKSFFGAARNIENGGSLTIVATAAVETASEATQVIFAELDGTQNSVVRLDRELAQRELFPAVQVRSSRTLRPETLLTEDEVAVLGKLRTSLRRAEPAALEALVARVQQTSSNAELLLAVSRTPLDEL